MIVPATRDDIAELEDIRRAAFSHFAPGHYTAREVATLLDDFDRSEALHLIDQQKLFLARSGRVALGVAGWHEGNVRHVYVRPAQARRGIGSRLLAAAERDFRRRSGAASIRANVAIYASSFYQANGYRLLLADRAWDGSAVFRMKKDF